MSVKRVSNIITNKEDIDFLLNITELQACKTSFMMECFGEFGDKRRFNPYDLFTVPEGAFGNENKKNKKPFMTTVGLWVFNKAFIEPHFVDIFGYVNEPITKKKLWWLNKQISYCVVEDRVPLDDMKDFIIKTQKFQPYCNILSPSISTGMMGISDTIRSKKNSLLNQNKEKLKDCDPITSQNIEDELLNACKEELKDDPGMDMINSGASISWGNNFKNMFVMRGAVKEADPKKGGFRIIESNFMDGVKPEEYADMANSLTGGPYARAKKTEVGGAWEKLFVKGLEHITVLPDGTDCGTKKTKEVELTDDAISKWMYSYMVEGSKLVELTSQNVDKYKGKKVKFRYSMHCESKKGICSICAGHLFNRIGVSAIGIASYVIPCAIKLKSMKQFHDSTVKIADMNDFGYKKIFGI